MVDIISIYPDANILAGYFLHILDKKRYPNESSFFNFCARHEDKIKVVLSSLTLVELTHMLKYSEEFQRYHLNDSLIDGLVSAVRRLWRRIL
ncbi:MAG: hypothetical protein HY051_02130 [Candidatus Aenigmarchaeota archaeon]|nr:hypothetical protein [Candidatus Aenigmarchaeota archaeon]